MSFYKNQRDSEVHTVGGLAFFKFLSPKNFKNKTCNICIIRFILFSEIKLNFQNVNKL